jgi:hypothetical protein
MIKSHFQRFSPLRACRLLAGLLAAAALAPAAYGEGWQVWPFNKEDKPGKPDKVVALWSDTILTQSGRPPTRGIGGRLMFYEGKNEEPIKVEGTLVVYAFDETDRDANNSRPDRKYVFTTQQLPGHYSKSKVGHSYSIWLPWDEVGGPQKELTLIVRFQPKEGAVAVSEPARQLLPGRIVPPAQARSPVAPNPPAVGPRGPAGDGAQTISYDVPITDGSGLITAAWQQRRLTTTTIPVPSGSLIGSAINSSQASPAMGAGYSGPGPKPAGQAPGPWQNYQQQNYLPQNSQPQNYPQQTYPPQNSAPPGYTPPPAPSGVSPGLQLRSGFQPGRPRPLGEPLAQLTRDHALTPPRPARQQSVPATPPGLDPANAVQAAQQGAPQWRN